jgi:hypothetical protein
MFKFTYSNLAPIAATDKNGKRMINTNVVRIWKQNDKIVFDRSFVNSKGEVSSHPIETVCDDLNPISIAKSIHWGCCGWSANVLQIHSLIKKVEEALDNSIIV